MTNPLIQIDDVVREMTDEELKALKATGWTEAIDETTIDPAGV